MLASLLDNVKKVWESIKTEAGLDFERYDNNIIFDLQNRLALDPNNDIGDELEKKNISIEDLIVAFFQIIQPFSEMMSDLLAMFEKAGAKRTDRNLAIEFDFGRELPNLKFDIEHFRDWLSVWRKVSGYFDVNLWNFNTIWQLNGIFSEQTPQYYDERVKSWIDKYRRERIWPDDLLPAPRSGIPELDLWLGKAWMVWTNIVTESKKYGRDRNILRRLGLETTEIPAEILPNSQDSLWSPNMLASIDSDHWAESFASGAYSKTERLSQMTRTERQKYAGELQASLEETFSAIPKGKVKGETLVSELIDFLNLPAWKQRHELYSAWISTQIINAIEAMGIEVRIHQVGGKLVFSFSGTHLATANMLPHLHIWAELRSHLENPVGKSRKMAIQPDYSLITDPISNPDASILEVECKQYLRPSRKNFAEAITDYARGRPNARVILVNYGPADQLILQSVDSRVRDRAHIIGEMRPSSPEAQRNFRNLVQKSISERYKNIVQQTKETSIPGVIRLEWGAKPSDLDLLLKILHRGETHLVSFQNKGSTMQLPWAMLKEDIRSGYGPEEIEISRWLPGKYSIAVRNYSKSPSIATGNAQLIFAKGNRL
ncbi:MAG: hypothetical protein AB1894_19545 [Chloroflexota bacterium]